MAESNQHVWRDLTEPQLERLLTLTDEMERNRRSQWEPKTRGEQSVARALERREIISKLPGHKTRLYSLTVMGFKVGMEAVAMRDSAPPHGGPD